MICAPSEHWMSALVSGHLQRKSQTLVTFAHNLQTIRSLVCRNPLDLANKKTHKLWQFSWQNMHLMLILQVVCISTSAPLSSQECFSRNQPAESQVARVAHRMHAFPPSPINLLHEWPCDLESLLLASSLAYQYSLVYFIPPSCLPCDKGIDGAMPAMWEPLDTVPVSVPPAGLWVGSQHTHARVVHMWAQHSIMHRVATAKCCCGNCV